MMWQKIDIMIVGAIILAAGRAKRMGAEKLMLPLAGKPVILHVIDAALAAGLAGPLVVTRTPSSDIAAAAAQRPVETVIADDAAAGMAHSLACGIRAVPKTWDAAFILLADMPLISSAMLRQMSELAGADRVIVPVHGGRRGNPTIWGRQHFAALAALTGDTGGRVLFGGLGANLHEMAWTDDSIFTDFDTPEDWAKHANR